MSQCIWGLISSAGSDCTISARPDTCKASGMKTASSATVVDDNWCFIWDASQYSDKQTYQSSVFVFSHRLHKSNNNLNHNFGFPQLNNMTDAISTFTMLRSEKLCYASNQALLKPTAMTADTCATNWSRTCSLCCRSNNNYNSHEALTQTCCHTLKCLHQVTMVTGGWVCGNFMCFCFLKWGREVCECTLHPSKTSREQSDGNQTELRTTTETHQ